MARHEPDPRVRIGLTITVALLNRVYPPAMAVTVPVMFVYNLVDTVANLAEREAAGRAGLWDYLSAAGETGLDVVSAGLSLSTLLRSLTAVGEEGLRTMQNVHRLRLAGRLYHAVDLGAETVIMSRQAIESIEELRSQHVLRIAELDARIRMFQRELGPDHPLVLQLDESLSREIAALHGATAQVVRQYATQIVLTQGGVRVAQGVGGGIRRLAGLEPARPRGGVEAEPSRPEAEAGRPSPEGAGGEPERPRSLSEEPRRSGEEGLESLLEPIGGRERGGILQAVFGRGIWSSWI